MKSQKHVVPHTNGWAVKSAGADKAAYVFSTKKEAFEKGREMAKAGNTELIIHDREGKIQEKNSYGKDPHPPKG